MRGNQDNYNSNNEQINDNDFKNEENNENVESNDNNNKEISSNRANKLNFTSINPASIIKLREVNNNS
jgi:hypothetical protein